MIELDGRSLRLSEVARVARGGADVRLHPAARQGLEAAQQQVAAAAAGADAVYGINTGFGDLASVRIPPEAVEDLQRRLLLSHAAGVGEPLSDGEVRSLLLLRANALAAGHSGIRPGVIERLLEFLRRDLLPVVPALGSVGASGDLAPLAHLALPLIGEGWLRRPGGTTRPARELLAEENLEPLRLAAKEGLALINGTQAMAALLAAALETGARLVVAADWIGAMSTEALRGTDTAFDARIHALRPHPGQRRSAARLWGLLAGSEIRASHRESDPRIQDPYSLRCMPQVHGAVADVVDDQRRRLSIEINAVTDNPLVFPEQGAILSGGNFHGEPLALGADFLAIALTELASISERRIEKLTNEGFSGLPAFLVAEPGLNSGFMIAQVTAAALLAECRVQAHPASVDSVPTSAEKEDHVSMGMTAALKLRRVVTQVARVLAIELLAAAQGIDLLRPLRSSDRIEEVHAALRRHVASWEEDRFLAPDLAAAERFLHDELLARLGEDPWLQEGDGS